MFYILAPLVGLAIDWAFFERTIRLVEAIAPMKTYRYMDFTGLRLVVIAAASVVVAYGHLERESVGVALLGGAVFLAAHFWIYGAVFYENFVRRR